MSEWDFPHYACEHGIRSGVPIVHLTGPTTTGNSGSPTPPCHPVLVEPGSQESQTGER